VVDAQTTLLIHALSENLLQGGDEAGLALGLGGGGGRGREADGESFSASACSRPVPIVLHEKEPQRLFSSLPPSVLPSFPTCSTSMVVSEARHMV